MTAWRCTPVMVLRRWIIPVNQFVVWSLGPPQRCFRILSHEQKQPPPHQGSGFIPLNQVSCPLVLSNPGDSLNSASLDVSFQEPLNMSQSFRKSPNSSSIKSLSPLGWGRQKYFLCCSRYLAQLFPSAFPRKLSMALIPSRESWRDNNQAVG